MLSGRQQRPGSGAAVGEALKKALALRGPRYSYGGWSRFRAHHVFQMLPTAVDSTIVFSRARSLIAGWFEVNVPVWWTKPR